MIKNIFKWLGVLGVVMSAIFPVSAATLYVGEDISTDKAIPADDVYFIGESTVVSKDIRGDIVVVSGDVALDGDISGDVLAVGGNITINGRVSDDVRVLGGNVTVIGEVGGDLVSGSGSITIADSANIRGDMVIGAGSFTLYGKVNGDLRAWFGEGRINGTVGGNAEVNYSDGLTFGNEGKVAGKLTYSASAEKVEFSDHAQSIEFIPTASIEKTKYGLAKLFTIAGLMALLWKWVSLLFVGALLIWVFPRLFPKLTDSARARGHVGQTIWTGLIFLVVVPAGGLLLMATLIGMPVAMILFFGYCLTLVMSSIVGSYGVGSFLRHHKNDTQWEQLGNLSLGLVIFLVASFIPVIGWLLQFVIVMFGVGTIWSEKVRMSKEYREPLR